MKWIGMWCICFCAVQVVEVMHAQGAAVATPTSAPRQGASLALSPAVAMLRGKPGQSATQTLTIFNGLPAEMRFQVEVQDIVVRDGKRVYLPAGQIPSSIAAGAVASPASVVALPGQSVSVKVTVTAPADTSQRAIVVYFRAQLAAAKDSVGFGASLGALLTFTLSDDARVVAGQLAATPQTDSANVKFSEELKNTGAEPVVPKGVIAIIDEHGKRIAKAEFEPQRLLPGELGLFTVVSPAVLSPGRYRTLSSFEFEGKVLTSAGEFTVSE